MRNLPINPWRIKAGDEIVYRWGKETFRFTFDAAPVKDGKAPFSGATQYKVPATLTEGLPWKAALLTHGGGLTLYADEKYFVNRV